MTMSLLLLLFVVGEVCGSLDLKETTTLTDRMDKLERLLSEQDARLSDQERKLAQQDKELIELRSVVRQQTSALSSQESLLRQQGLELTQEKNVNRQQALELSNQKRMLRQQSAQLSGQGILLRQQVAKLSHQERLLSQQSRLLKRLRSGHLGSPATIMTEDEWQFPSDNLNDVTNATSDKTETVTSPSRLGARSDDAGSWEAVVSHISQRVTEMSADITALKNSNIQRDNDIQDAQSSTFVQWGSSQCSNSSWLVYSGIVGGSSNTHSGAATNYLCLTLSPVLITGQGGGTDAYLYGGEYHAFSNKDPVCSVCRSTFSTTVMIPGTNVCTPGWHLQYSGWLMAGRYDHAAGSEFICVDSRLEAAQHSEAVELGKLLYVTFTRCGSLPCPPYVNDKLVTCAVCSK